MTRVDYMMANDGTGDDVFVFQRDRSGRWQMLDNDPRPPFDVAALAAGILAAAPPRPVVHHWCEHISTETVDGWREDYASGTFVITDEQAATFKAMAEKAVTSGRMFSWSTADRPRFAG